VAPDSNKSVDVNGCTQHHSSSSSSKPWHDMVRSTKQPTTVRRNPQLRTRRKNLIGSMASNRRNSRICGEQHHNNHNYAHAHAHCSHTHKATNACCQRH
jgi:hypothetical protein